MWLCESRKILLEHCQDSIIHTHSMTDMIHRLARDEVCVLREIEFEQVNGAFFNKTKPNARGSTQSHRAQVKQGHRWVEHDFGEALRAQGW